MKIVHCLIHYFPYHMAGTEVYTHALAGLQKKEGHQVSVVTPYIDWRSPGNINEHYQYDGIDVYQFLEPGNPSNPDLYTGKKKPEGVENFVSLLKKLQPDIVNFHELNISNSFCMDHVKAAKQFGAKVFYSMHLSAFTCYTNVLVKNKKLCGGKLKIGTCTACSYNTLFNIPYTVAQPLSFIANIAATLGISSLIKKSRLKTFLSVPMILQRKQNDISEALRFVDKLVCLTDWYREILVTNKVPDEKIVVIKQGLATNPGAISNTVKNEAIGNAAIRLVFIGRLQPQKGVLMLINTVNAFSPNLLTLDIYGKEEKDSEYFNQCMEAINNSANIHWHGPVSSSQVVELISRYDMLCLPSAFSEMSPLVIQEAFAAGVPVLASRVYGNAEQVKHGANGLLFDFNSAASLCQQLKNVLANPDMLKLMKQHIAMPHSFNEVHKQYMAMYAA